MHVCACAPPLKLADIRIFTYRFATVKNSDRLYVPSRGMLHTARTFVTVFVFTYVCLCCFANLPMKLYRYGAVKTTAIQPGWCLKYLNLIPVFF